MNRIRKLQRAAAARYCATLGTDYDPQAVSRERIRQALAVLHSMPYHAGEPVSLAELRRLSGNGP